MSHGPRTIDAVATTLVRGVGRAHLYLPHSRTVAHAATREEWPAEECRMPPQIGARCADPRTLRRIAEREPGDPSLNVPTYVINTALTGIAKQCKRRVKGTVTDFVE
uniref:Uncharacterized protein n=1 Tax=Plectus sambesii TaxID=2011161 RepID=A0A914WA70_9BILA